MVIAALSLMAVMAGSFPAYQAVHAGPDRARLEAVGGSLIGMGLMLLGAGLQAATG